MQLKLLLLFLFSCNITLLAASGEEETSKLDLIKAFRVKCVDHN
jgi:hypothetical protein